MHSRQSLARDFRALGILPGDTVMVHASVRAVGEVAGGPDIIHLALEDALTAGGTLMMYASCPRYYDEVGRRNLTPEQEREVLEKLPPFDPFTARSARDNGVLVEFLRTCPGSRVNPHVARFVVWGKHADYLISHQPWNYAFGSGSALDRFLMLDGRILSSTATSPPSGIAGGGWATPRPTWFAPAPCWTSRCPTCGRSRRTDARRTSYGSWGDCRHGYRTELGCEDRGDGPTASFDTECTSRLSWRDSAASGSRWRSPPLSATRHTPLDTIDFLSTVPLLSGLDASELAPFAAMVRERSYPRGSVIVFEDDPGDSLFIVRQGRVKVVLIGEDGREVILGILGVGDHFGELSLIDGQPRSAHVIAMEDSQLIVLRREDFRRRVHESPAVAWAFLVELSRRLRKADEQIGNLVLLDVDGRIARLLLEAADEGGGGAAIQKRLTHQTIAQMIGASRETVSRAMRTFQDRGLIAVHRRQVTIVDREGLERLAQVRV